MARPRRLPARFTVIVLAVAAVAAAPAAGVAQSRALSTPRAHAAMLLSSALDRGMRAAGRASGAYVLDLQTGQPLYASQATTGRLPASVEKLWTTSAVLEDFGPNARLQTTVFASGTVTDGTFRGILYLHGGGDPTFGSAVFDRANYGTGATVEALAAAAVKTLGLRAVQGTIVVDESYLDSRRGTPATGYRADPEVEGSLSALAFNRDWVDPWGLHLDAHPALRAGSAFAAALRAAGVRVPASVPVRPGVTPTTARYVAAVNSPTTSTIVRLTNAPSDNFFAETLLKDLGARYGTAGSTAGGAAVVRAAIAAQFGLHPRLDDGSGLSRFDRSTPIDVVSLLSEQADNLPFYNSLAVAGETGTLRHELRGTPAQGRCRGKTGTLTDASNVVGYCQARDGHTLAYAFLMNRINPDAAHPIQNAMELALVGYDG